MEPLRVRQPMLAASATLSVGSSCTPYTLPSNGVLQFLGADPTTLVADAVYSPLCTAAALTPQPAIIANGGFDIDQTSNPSNPQFSDLRDPFYASIFPQCYALAATTVLAYLLLIMLVIAPRSFLDGGVVVLGRRGFTNGPSNGISIGGRPWLQKVAALTVAISLTIATADTFRVAEEQYAWGTQNAQRLQEDVLGGTQLKVIQLISDTFLWLAQAQTLIRLFPRQREKVIIKWTAFSLITLDVIFGALNSFHYTGQGNTRPRSFTDAVPALSYLFQLSLGLLYAAWVLYYALMKKRYAFYHPLMKNICLMAMLSIISILVPVVFFVLDIAEPEFTGWGDYVRWVGAAAASVVVWEWVERIEALEREEKKDGVLGREVFDGDEMMEAFPSDLTWPLRRKNKRKDDDDDEGESSNSSSMGGRSNMWPAMSSVASRYRSKSGGSPDGRQQASSTARSATRFLQPPMWPSRPPPAITPVSRTDTASADSTVYAVRYQPLTETTTRTTEERHGRPLSRGDSATSSVSSPIVENNMQPMSIPPSQQPSSTTYAVEKKDEASRWHYFNPFHRTAREPPAEVLPHTMPKQPKPRRDFDSTGRWDVKARMEIFAATQAERVLEKIRPTPDTDSLPVTVIPAPPRRGAALAQLLEEEELQVESHEPRVSTSQHQARNIGDESAATGPMMLSQRVARSNSTASNALRSSLSPTERNNPSTSRPPISRDSNSFLVSAQRRGDQRERLAGERRPVDDIIRDEQHHDSSPV
ncbi:pH-response regulator protein palH/rim-21 [Hypoxylon fragiforme]|uniref:pH-response regulator protein palH/rim-21 n=1 Tax=Hypoxylon fragiforme TaxID=63214 RepID=UPI0020C68E7E|nr:pH-response regulator protein palH/rim-21 [Hypoxylon fragiforme]KAI2612231.1 pH-response regulator protein palH/rim-21 [Hypoxylon fragiforme]